MEKIVKLDRWIYRGFVYRWTRMHRSGSQDLRPQAPRAVRVDRLVSPSSTWRDTRAIKPTYIVAQLAGGYAPAAVAVAYEAISCLESDAWVSSFDDHAPKALGESLTSDIGPFSEL